MSNELIPVQSMLFDFDYNVFDQDTVTLMQEAEDKIIGRTKRVAAENGKDLLKFTFRLKRSGHADRATESPKAF